MHIINECKLSDDGPYDLEDLKPMAENIKKNIDASSVINDSDNDKDNNSDSDKNNSDNDSENEKEHYINISYIIEEMKRKKELLKMLLNSKEIIENQI